MDSYKFYIKKPSTDETDKSIFSVVSNNENNYTVIK